MDKVNLLNDIFRLCIVPLLAVLVSYLVAFIRKKSNELQVKVDNEYAAKYINMLSEIVADCVVATNQTYVEALKEKNAFDEEAQKQAFQLTYNAVMNILSDEAKNVLTTIYGDLPTLLNQLIESFVNRYK